MLVMFVITYQSRTCSYQPGIGDLILVLIIRLPIKGVSIHGSYRPGAIEADQLGVGSGADSAAECDRVPFSRDVRLEAS